MDAGPTIFAPLIPRLPLRPWPPLCRSLCIERWGHHDVEASDHHGLDVTFSKGSAHLRLMWR
ncbi:MAG: hypothetical protein ACK559_15700 [bacterium]